MRRRTSQNPGFTLIELVLVMVILFIVTAAAVPMLTNFGKGRRAGNCATQIVSLTDWAHTQAISRGVSIRFNLDAGKQIYQLTVEQPQGGFGPLEEEFGRLFEPPEGVRVDWDAPQQPDGRYITFRPTGRTEMTMVAPVVQQGPPPVPAMNTGVTIRIIDPDGQVTLVACPSATEVFTVIGDTQQTR